MIANLEIITNLIIILCFAIHFYMNYKINGTETECAFDLEGDDLICNKSGTYRFELDKDGTKITPVSEYLCEDCGNYSISKEDHICPSPALKYSESTLHEEIKLAEKYRAPEPPKEDSIEVLNEDDPRLK